MIQKVQTEILYKVITCTCMIHNEKRRLYRQHQSYWGKECPGETWYRVEEFKHCLG